jgi:hypothetical protein
MYGASTSKGAFQSFIHIIFLESGGKLLFLGPLKCGMKNISLDKIQPEYMIKITFFIMGDTSKSHVLFCSLINFQKIFTHTIHITP